MIKFPREYKKLISVDSKGIAIPSNGIGKTIISGL